MLTRNIFKFVLPIDSMLLHDTNAISTLITKTSINVDIFIVTTVTTGTQDTRTANSPRNISPETDNSRTKTMSNAIISKKTVTIKNKDK